MSAEAGNKQTYRPVQPRVFVDFNYEDLLSLTNLKKPCASHANVSIYKMPVFIIQLDEIKNMNAVTAAFL